MNIKYTSCFLRLSFIFMLACIFSSSHSATRYWVGSGNWNTTGNWSNTSGGASGSSVPGVSDTAFFNGIDVVNCAIDANVNVAGFSISSLYTGIISVNSGMTITISTYGFSQAGGTFTGDNSNITINGSFNLSGGTFNSTTAVLLITLGYTYTGGTFNHNSGTVSFSSTQTISGNTSFYNLLFVANGGVYTIAGGTIISSINNVTISGGFAYTINTGTLSIKGNLTLTSSSNNSLNGGTATFLFDGTGTQNISSALGSIIVGTNERVCALPAVEINKISGSLNLSGIINMNGATWKTTAGTSLVNPGTSTLNIIPTITFSGQNLSLYNIHILANAETITLNPAAYVLTSTNNVTINGGGFYILNTGILEIKGDLTLISTGSSAINGGTGTFLFNGTGTQNINSSASGLNNICALPNVEINKISGALNLTGIINFSGTSWNTVAGTSLINAGTSVVNILKTTTLSGQNLSLYDMVITGNFSFITISSGLIWTSTHLLTLAGAGSWYQINTGTLNAKGDVLVTNTSTSTNGGGTAILLFDGAASQILTGSGVAGGGKLPQVQINKTGGTLTLSNSTISTDNSWTHISGQVDASTNASTVDFYKTSIIDGQGTSTTMAFYHVIFSGAVSLGGKMDVNGDFTIRSGVGNKLDVTSTNYQLNVAGNWINNNSVTATSFNQQGGTVVFDGGNAQALTLASTTHTEIFYNLEMNNSSSGLTLNAPATISNNLNFIAGNIISTASNILLIVDAATSTGASNNSFVSGPVDKTGSQAFIFPVGKNAVYAPIAISAPGISTNQFTAEYFQANPSTLYNTNSKDVSLNHVSTCEYWMLDRTAGTSNVTVSLSWDTRSCGVTISADLRVAHWDGSQWKDLGNGGTTASTVVSSAAVTSFSPFTLASNSNANPLPVKLMSFTGQYENEQVVLQWSTASETSNDFFTVERSAADIGWERMKNIAGAGNSIAILHYTFTDTKPYGGLSYYRIKQTDYNGSITNSPIVTITNHKESYMDNNLVIFSNPSNGKITFLFNGDQDHVRSIEIYNSMGQRVYYAGSYMSSVDISDRPAGTYYIRFNLDAKVIIKRMVIEK